MKYRLLIVDDEYDIRDGLLHFNWENLGFTAVAAVANGVEALDYVLKHPVEVVLCDIRMPKMDGIEFAKQVREKNISLKIVYLTAYRDIELIRQAIKYQCKDYLLKPTRFSQLTEVFSDMRSQLDNENYTELIDVSDSQSDRADVLIQMSKKYVLQHLSSASLRTVAEFLHLSPSYFSTLFKEKTGSNFMHYYLKSRMELSKELLNDPRKSVAEVAKAVGYTNAKNFARAFKNMFSVSPVEYRDGLDR